MFNNLQILFNKIFKLFYIIMLKLKNKLSTNNNNQIIKFS